MKQEPANHTTQATELLSRGEAIKKLGGYAALTALGTFMILSPQKAQAASAPTDPGGGGGEFENACNDGDTATCCPFCYDSDPSTLCTECDTFTAETANCPDPEARVQSPLPFKAIQQTVILPPNLILNQNTNQSINQSTRKNNISH